MSVHRCAVCQNIGNTFHGVKVHLEKHLQGVGTVILPLTIDCKRINILVCKECLAKINAIIPKAVVENHWEEV